MARVHGETVEGARVAHIHMHQRGVLAQHDMIP